MPLSVLSALARLNLDPWHEAAELSDLPKDTAAQRLAALIALLPGDAGHNSGLKEEIEVASVTMTTNCVENAN
jgi:hypothetical protein